MHGPTPEDAEEFAKQMLEDLNGNPEDPSNARYLAGAKDTQSGNYILMMMVPSSALSDGMGPELWGTPDKNKFLAAISEDVCFAKAAEIEENYPLSDGEKKNELMAEFLAEFMPALFERAMEMKPLDI